MGSNPTGRTNLWLGGRMERQQSSKLHDKEKGTGNHILKQETRRFYLAWEWDRAWELVLLSHCRTRGKHQAGSNIGQVRFSECSDTGRFWAKTLQNLKQKISKFSFFFSGKRFQECDSFEKLKTTKKKVTEKVPKSLPYI